MNSRLIRLGVAWMAALVMAGCGGGGGGGFAFPPVAGTTTPPASGGTPPSNQADPYDAFLAYLKALVTTALDTAEAADVAAFDPPPTSETKEPIATQ